LRFFAPAKDMTQNFVARFTQIDYARAMAFIAIEPDTGRHSWSVSKEPGIGWALMQHLIAYAKAEGLLVLEGEVLTENIQMLSMCWQLGFGVSSHPDDYGLCHVTLPLGSGAD
jgi:acetyltransferase